MQHEIKKYVTHVTAMKEGSFTAEFCFPGSFTGFDGHFADQPVLPGVCLIQAVLVAAELVLKQKPVLTEIVLSKFTAVSLPDETLRAACTVNEDMLRAKISRGADRVAEIRLRVQYA